MENEVTTVQPAGTVQWYQSISYKDAKIFIRTNLTTAARSFIAVGYYLKHIRDTEGYREDGFADIWEFANAEYGISMSTASRYMSMNDRFSQSGNSPLIRDEYKGFGKSQLQEMLSLTGEQLEQVRPTDRVEDIRNMRKPREIPYMEIPGQVELTDFPGVDPADMQAAAEAREKLAANSQDQPAYTVSAADLLGEDTSRQPIAISQQQEARQESVPELVQPEAVPATEQEPPKEVIDAEFEEIQESEEEELTDLQIAELELERANNLLAKCLKDLPDETNVHIKGMKIKAAALASYVCTFENALNPPSKPEQPDLPLLKNNERRAAFVDAYETWPLWIETAQTGERYYRYDLEDGTSMVVKVYHARLFAGFEEGSYKSQYHEGYGRHEYYLLQPGKFFRDCDTNRSLLIEKLKEIQKVKKGNGGDGHKANQ